ncbi:MAG: putative conserved small protein [Rhodobacteraceae bacterium HLUCCO07]|uniref:DUF1127 domain-containing protein n=1 Tax=Aquicoccus sp. TaxID=2055851 RepID=UPI0006D9472F|nr:MAG: putative conserved small protein [Rhodobacteraceae bacterium HLUCCO07]
MAFAGNTQAAPHHGLAGLAVHVEALVERFNLYRHYRRTLAELGGLNARDLAEIGLCRSNIRSAAYEAVYGSQN